MSKCGKGCMPECEYFTTGGCISPFNCPYKIETGYINSATSIPTYMEQYNGMSDDDIKRLKAENADLHEKLKEAEHRAEVAEERLKKLKKTEGDLTVEEEINILENLLEEAKHRSFVFERELVKYKKAFDNIMEVFHETLSAIFPDTKIDLDEWKKDILANAEKASAEEKNNDRERENN